MANTSKPFTPSVLAKTGKVAYVVLEQAMLSNVLTGPILRAMGAATDETEAAAKSGELAALEKASREQQLKLQMYEAQAKLAQEVAIATRIEAAQEVQIEEYYEGAGEGAVGVKKGDSGVTLGASGSGRRVTKRVVKFKGFRVVPESERKLDGAPATPHESNGERTVPPSPAA